MDSASAGLPRALREADGTVNGAVDSLICIAAEGGSTDAWGDGPVADDGAESLGLCAQVGTDSAGGVRDVVELGGLVEADEAMPAF